MRPRGSAGRIGNARGRILIPVLLALSAITAVFFCGIYASRGRQLTNVMTDKAHTVTELEQKGMASDALLLRALASRVEAEPALAEALAGRDVEHLKRLGDKTFQGLHDNFGVIRLNLLGPDRQSLAAFGEVAPTAAVLDPFGAEFPNEMEVNLVLDAGGGLLLDVIVPWQVAGKTIGYLDLASDASRITESIHEATNCELLFLVRKDLFDRQAWQKGERRRGEDDGWDILMNSVAVAQTMKAIPTSLGLLLEEGGQPQRVVVGGEARRSVFHVAWVPVNDKDGNALGSIVVLRDVSRSADTFRQTILLTVVLFVVTGAILFFLVNSVLRDVERRGRDIADETAGEDGRGAASTS